MTAALELGPSGLGLPELRRAWQQPLGLALTATAWNAVDASAATVERLLEDDRPIYGINTGFGLLARTRIPPDELGRLQRNLVLSHAAGVGDPLPRAVVRLTLLLKVSSLAQGHSGIRRRTLEALLRLLEADALPVIPAQGSVGASGDLAPLAHLTATLLGEGDVELDGSMMPAAAALQKLELAPLTLAPKEGLALLNGTQVSTALGLAGLFAAERVFGAAVTVGAMTVDAAKGSDAPFDRRIHALRRHAGQQDIAAALRALLAGSEIRASHAGCDRVQDPYCLRCQPQVLGACLDQLRHASGILVDEANAITDNPLVFPETREILSGGNFHAEPVAFAADNLALVLAELGNIAERRIALLVDPHMSGLPAFLVEDSGLNSGFMIPQVTAAALAAENKCLASPASVDSIPTSANQEDHVSMATHGARRLLTMARNAGSIVGIEALAAAQGIDFHRPLRSSVPLESAYAAIRDRVPRLEADRYLAPDLDAGVALVEDGTIAAPALARITLEATA